MIIKVGNREIKVKRCQSSLTTLEISTIDNTVTTRSVVNMDAAETAALISALETEAPSRYFQR